MNTYCKLIPHSPLTPAHSHAASVRKHLVVSVPQNNECEFETPNPPLAGEARALVVYLSFLIKDTPAVSIHYFLPGVLTTGVEPSIAMFSLFLGLKGSITELKIPSRNLWLVRLCLPYSPTAALSRY
jgi:hypothetical protein